MKPRFKRVLLIAPLAIVGILLFAALGGEIVKLLWNWLLPPLFGWKAITFWQGLALLVLCRILFGGRGFFGGPNRSRFRRRMGEQWELMTAEERARFREGMRARCGFDAAGSETGGAPD